MSMTNSAASVLPLSVYSILSGEHKEVKGLLKMLAMTPEAFQGGREALWRKVRHELLAHAHAEQQTVYDVAEARTGEAALFDEARDAHMGIESLITELDHVDKESEQWKKGLETLRAEIDRHVEEEENEMFAEMQKVISDDEAKELGELYREEKKKQMHLEKG